MRFMKRFALISLFVLSAFGAAALPTLADCQEGTAADDTINCDTNSSGLGGQGGNDTIIIDAGTTVGHVGGDSRGGSNGGNGPAGDDTIINNGTVSTIVGDYTDGLVGGNDTIINNGTADNIFGDYMIDFAAGGDDIITNNGTVNGDINGDQYVTTGGSDTITNTGTVAGNIYGDGVTGVPGGGNDTIVNTGTVGGSIVGQLGEDNITNTGVVGGDILGDFGDSNSPNDKDDTITNAGTVTGNIKGNGGNDTITIVVGSVVGGTISGDDGTDTLIFSGTTSDQAGYDQIQAFVGCNPCSGTVTLDGRTYTFNSFEDLQNLLILLIQNGFVSIDINFAQRVNGGENGAPFALYCNDSTIRIVDIGADGQGGIDFQFSLSELPPVGDEPIVLASAGDNQLLLQPDGTLLAVGTSLDGTKTYSLPITTTCGSLGAGTEG